ncbi:MAG: branched-chain amino acid ABC transporter permease [Armatimonadetes bacterium]|nr:branched-chain amino acid ABC transporter permease [Armatimonadota bacterium]
MASRRHLLLTALGLSAAYALDRMSGHFPDYFLKLALFTSINILMAASLNLINGIAGQFSLGHAGFMAVGGYTAGAVTVYALPWLTARLGLPDGAVFFAATLAGGLAAALVGLIVGLPTLRLKGDYLAIATLGFGEIVGVIIVNLDSVGGARGFLVPMLTTPFWVWAWMVAGLAVIWAVMRSAHGRALLAIREDETAAAGIGIPVVRYKVYAFMLGGFFAGISGSLLGHRMALLNPSSFGFLRSVDYVIMVVLGGMGHLPGVCLGAVVITLLPEALRLMGLGEWRMILYALLLLLLMLLRPQGLFGKRLTSL